MSKDCNHPKCQCDRFVAQKWMATKCNTCMHSESSHNNLSKNEGHHQNAKTAPARMQQDFDEKNANEKMDPQTEMENERITINFDRPPALPPSTPDPSSRSIDEIPPPIPPTPIFLKNSRQIRTNILNDDPPVLPDELPETPLSETDLEEAPPKPPESLPPESPEPPEPLPELPASNKVIHFANLPDFYDEKYESENLQWPKNSFDNDTSSDEDFIPLPPVPLESDQESSLESDQESSDESVKSAASDELPQDTQPKMLTRTKTRPDMLRCHISKRNKYGRDQKRIVTFDGISLKFFDKSKPKSETPITHVEKVKPGDLERKVFILFKDQGRRDYDLLFQNKLEAQEFLNVINEAIKKCDNKSSLSSSGSLCHKKIKSLKQKNRGSSEYLEYHVKKRSKLKKIQLVIIVLHSKKMILLDQKRKIQKSYPLEHIYSVETGKLNLALQNHKTNWLHNELFIIFSQTESYHEQALHIYFPDSFNQEHFIAQLISRRPDLLVEDNSTLNARNSFCLNSTEHQLQLRFCVQKTNKAKVTKKRIIALLPKKKVLRSFNHEKNYKDYDFAKVKSIGRGQNDDFPVSICFKNRDPLNISFVDAIQQQTFLYHSKNMLHEALEIKEDNNAHISIYVGTYNVGDSLPSNLEKVFKPNSYDIYTICLQECNKDTRGDWISQLKSHINGSEDNYCTLATERLMEIVVLILVRKAHFHKITNIQTGTIPTGIGDIIGNKGGVVVGFNFEDTSICFVGSHLAARAERLPQRRENYIRIIKNTGFGEHNVDIIHDYDHLFWLGDLNYRTEKKFDETVQLLHEKKYDEIIACDQLKKEIKKKRVFIDFKEGNITFAPTYRWERKENIVSNKKEQPPSYTDRVLWHSLDTTSLTQKEYSSAPDMFGSDHRPVFAVFLLQPRLFQSPICQTEKKLCFCFKKLVFSCSPDIIKPSNLGLTISSLLCKRLKIREYPPITENVEQFKNKKHSPAPLDDVLEKQEVQWTWPDVTLASWINNWDFVQQYGILVAITQPYIELSQQEDQRNAGHHQKVGFCYFNLRNLSDEDRDNDRHMEFTKNVTKDGAFIGTLSGMISTRLFMPKKKMPTLKRTSKTEKGRYSTPLPCASPSASVAKMHISRSKTDDPSARHLHAAQSAKSGIRRLSASLASSLSPHPSKKSFNKKPK